MGPGLLLWLGYFTVDVTSDILLGFFEKKPYTIQFPL
jgi:hypothetical protein